MHKRSRLYTTNPKAQPINRGDSRDQPASATSSNEEPGILTARLESHSLTSVCSYAR